MSNTNIWDCATCDTENILEDKIENNGELIIIGYNKPTNSVFIGFRGSSNIQNWISNIQIVFTHPYEDSTIAVSDGFYKLYMSFREQLLEKIQIVTKKYDINNVFITGHSLGGALATLCAFDIMYNELPYTISQHITFGSPRVGNNVFFYYFKAFGIYSKRVTHQYDIVPHVPEEFLGYEHINNEIWYDEHNVQYTICDDYNEEDPNCSNSCAPTKCTSTSDHLNYLNVSMGNDGFC
jgi:predicted lipase